MAAWGQHSRRGFGVSVCLCLSSSPLLRSVRSALYWRRVVSKAASLRRKPILWGRNRPVSRNEFAFGTSVSCAAYAARWGMVRPAWDVCCVSQRACKPPCNRQLLLGVGILRVPSALAADHSTHPVPVHQHLAIVGAAVAALGANCVAGLADISFRKAGAHYLYVQPRLWRPSWLFDGLGRLVRVGSASAAFFLASKPAPSSIARPERHISPVRAKVVRVHRSVYAVAVVAHIRLLAQCCLPRMFGSLEN
jgi:hypothetical protein